MLGALFLILACQLVGEALVHLTGLPIPGPVIGMVVLFLYLCVKKHIPDAVDHVGGTLLAHLSLLFIPAGVGVIQYVDQIENEIAAIIASIIGATLITVAITAWMAQRLLHKSPHV